MTMTWNNAKRGLLLVGLAAASLSGCVLSEPVQGMASLTDTRWNLRSLDQGDTPSDAPAQPVQVEFGAQGALGGQGGCNRLMGRYTIDEAGLQVGDLAMTKRACIQGMDWDNRLGEVLSQSKGWRIQDQMLQLLDAQGNSLATFDAEPSAD
nr:META domain-containing protein [Oceanococcus sp. HetDA_MAG_MS8]